MKKLICFLLVIVFVITLVACGGSTEPAEEKAAFEFTTDGGINCKVYNGCTPSEAAAVCTAIKKLNPDANTDDVTPSDCIIERYDDGLLGLTIPSVKVGEYDYGVVCYYEFTDDKEKNFSVHYLKVGPDELVNDGIDLDGKYNYGGSEE